MSDIVITYTNGLEHTVRDCKSYEVSADGSVMQLFLEGGGVITVNFREVLAVFRKRDRETIKNTTVPVLSDLLLEKTFEPENGDTVPGTGDAPPVSEGVSSGSAEAAETEPGTAPAVGQGRKKRGKIT